MSLFMLTVACSKHNDELSSTKEDFRIANGNIKSPKWLVNAVDGIADQYNRNPDTGKRIYSSIVCFVEHENQVFINIFDVLSSHSILGNRYYTISGDPVDPTTDLYNDLCQEQDREMFWCAICP